jgi:hypothetical protein
MFFGLGINASMDQRTIGKIQPTLDLLNKDVYRQSQSNVYTYDPMWPKITIYHKAYTKVNRSFAHGEHDPESISCMFHSVPCMSQTLKDHIWTQLSLGYTTKQKMINIKQFGGNV